MNSNTREYLKEFIEKLQTLAEWIDLEPDSRPQAEFQQAAEDLKRQLDQDETIP